MTEEIGTTNSITESLLCHYTCLLPQEMICKWCFNFPSHKSCGHNWHLSLMMDDKRKKKESKWINSLGKNIPIWEVIFRNFGSYTLDFKFWGISCMRFKLDSNTPLKVFFCFIFFHFLHIRNYPVQELWMTLESIVSSINLRLLYYWLIPMLNVGEKEDTDWEVIFQSNIKQNNT